MKRSKLKNDMLSYGQNLNRRQLILLSMQYFPFIWIPHFFHLYQWFYWPIHTVKSESYKKLVKIKIANSYRRQ